MPADFALQRCDRLRIRVNAGGDGSPGGDEGDPLKGTLLSPTSGSLKGDLIERVYIPRVALILTPRVLGTALNHEP